MCIAPDFSSKQVQPQTNWSKFYIFKFSLLFPRVESCEMFQLGGIHQWGLRKSVFSTAEWSQDFKISPSLNVLNPTGFDTSNLGPFIFSFFDIG